MGGGKTACLQSSRGEHWCTGVNGGLDGEQGVSAVVDGVVSNMAGVGDAGGGKTVHWWGFWGKLGHWDVFCRFSVGPGNMSCHFVAAVRGLGWGRAGYSVVVDGHVVNDVVVALGVSG